MHCLSSLASRYVHFRRYGEYCHYKSIVIIDHLALLNKSRVELHKYH